MTTITAKETFEVFSWVMGYGEIKAGEKFTPLAETTGCYAIKFLFAEVWIDKNKFLIVS